MKSVDAARAAVEELYAILGMRMPTNSTIGAEVHDATEVVYPVVREIKALLAALAEAR